MSGNNTLVRRDNRAVTTHQQVQQDVSVLQELPKSPLDKIEGLNNLFLALQGKVNLICPLAAVDTILPMHQVSVRAVYINPDLGKKGIGPECYRVKPWCDDDEVALGKVALDKIEAAAGVRRIGGGRTDDRSQSYYCEFSVTLEITDFDGTKRSEVGTKELDLRDGAPKTLKAEYVNGQKTGRLIPMDPTALSAAREHMLALCETKARLRALRTLLSLQHKYTLDDMAKPFVIPKLVPHLDVNDPETKTALINHALGNTQAIYGKASSIIDTQQLPPETMPPSKQIHGGRIDDDDQGDQTGRSDPGASTQTQPELPMDSQDELASFGEPPAAAPQQIFECGCPCGHGAAITQRVFEWTKERLGTPRCEKCYPWTGNGAVSPKFDFASHETDRDLGIKSHPGLTPRKLQESLKAQR